MNIEIQSIASCTPQDVACAIAGMEPHEISDLMLMIAEKMSNPHDICNCAMRLQKHSIKRFGFYVGIKEGLIKED